MHFNMTINVRCGHKSKVNPDSQDFGILPFIEFLYIVKMLEISSLLVYDKSESRHLKACEKYL